MTNPFSRTERVYFTLVELINSEEQDIDAVELILGALTDAEAIEFEQYIAQLKAMYGIE